MGNKYKVGTFAHVAKVTINGKHRPNWAVASLSVTAHGDGVFSIASADFSLTREDLSILVRTGQEVLIKLEEEN